MLNGHSAQLESWRPDFSHPEQGVPTWIRVTVREGEVTNALNEIGWDENPFQVILCEECGHTGCAMGGYVHIAHLADWILWTAPQAAEHQSEYEPEHPLVRRYGGVAIHREKWERWRARAYRLPGFDRLPLVTGRTLADAWRMSAVGPGRVSALPEVVPTLRRHLLAADSLGVDDAIVAVAKIVARLEETAGHVVLGTLIHPEAVAARMETLYFDGPEVTEWPALALTEGEPLLALASDLVFVPGRPASDSRTDSAAGRSARRGQAGQGLPGASGSKRGDALGPKTRGPRE